MTRITFHANFACFIGSHGILTGETLDVLEDVDGLYWLYFYGELEPIARLSKDDVNKLAGHPVV